MWPSSVSSVPWFDARHAPESILLPRIHRNDLDRLTGDDDASILFGDPRRPSVRQPRRDDPVDRSQTPPTRPHTRHDGRESFKCGRCRAFIGPTVSGGRHRNHCPICLTSRHVDAGRPGDRASTCRALMAPVGTFFRRDGEQMVVHRCNGCGIARQNRIAADDNPLALLRLPVVAPPTTARHEEAEEAIA